MERNVVGYRSPEGRLCLQEGRPYLQDLRRLGMVKLWELSGAMVAGYYRDLLGRFGASPQALAERSGSKDFDFYSYLFGGIELAPQLSVLDVGCGMGDVIAYLQQRHIGIHDYLGIDLLQPFVAMCRARYAAPYSFICANFVSDTWWPNRRYDMVVNMGVLVSRVACYEAYIEYCVHKMMALAERYVLFNVITEVDLSQGHYRQMRRIGQITAIPRPALLRILDRVARAAQVRYLLHEVRIYPDATDAFVQISRV